MSTRCKVGDLAIVTYTPDGNDIGKVVEILSGWGKFEDLGYLWTVQFSHPIQASNRDGRNPRMTSRAECPDAWLRPVSGLPLDDEAPIETNLPDPLYLALGITSRSYAA